MSTTSVPRRPVPPSSRRARRAALAPWRRAFRLRPLLLGIAAAFGACAGAGVQAQGGLPAGTLPQGGQVVVGSGQIAPRPGNLLQITQTTPRLGIDWQSFSIGSGATVEFLQPDAASVALNRVLGSDPSQIFGRLRANGQVFLANPNGVLFAPGARVDVGGLVASTLDLSQQDFAAGLYRFNGHSAAGVLNQGRIDAAAGGYVALFGREVGNEGTITVPAGSVVLASGRAATVAIAGGGLISAAITPGEAGSVANAGSIAADGGTVRLTAQSAEGVAASLVNNSGVVRANTLVERGGEIWLSGDRVASTGTLRADAPAGGDAGRVMLMGDMARGSVRVDGTLSAAAGGDGGAGGQVETSAAQVQVAGSAQVGTLAASGRHGTWTIDPTNFTVGAGNADQTASGIGADKLASSLLAGNVQIATAAAGSEAGDIIVAAPVSWQKNTTLTLTAAGAIRFNANVDALGRVDEAGNPGLALTAPGGVLLADKVKVTLGANAPTYSLNGNAYTVVRTLAQLQAIDASDAARSGRYVLGSDIDASASAAQDGGKGFSPIGGSARTSDCFDTFCGTFDGLGHAITGLTINRPGENYVGLFGTTRNATLRNFSLVGGSVTGGFDVGAVAGWNSGSTSLANIAGSAAVARTSAAGDGSEGGLVGYINTTATLQNLSASGNVTVSAPTAHVGGLIGRMVGTGTASVRSSRASGAVNLSGIGGTSYAGGLIGQVELGAAGTIADSSATGKVTATGNGTTYAGGLVGAQTGGSVATATAGGDVAFSYTGGGSPSASVGGLLGYFSGTAVSDGSAAGKVSGGSYVGGLIGESYGSGAMTRLSASGDVSGTLRVGGLVGHAEGAGSFSDASASGTVVSTGTSNNSYTGGLIGWQRTTGGLDGGHFTGTSVTGNWDVGGLVGNSFTGGSITNSSASGAVVATSTASVGGLVGYFRSDVAGNGIVDSQATGAVTANTSGGGHVGGLVGHVDGFNGGAVFVRDVAGGDVASVYTRATGTSDSAVGGLIGYFNGASLNDSSASGRASGGNYAGGLVGVFRATGANAKLVASGDVSGLDGAGGLFGSADGAGSLKDSSASGNVAATGSYAGGLAGFYGLDGGLTGSKTTGRTVSGAVEVGGLIGRYDSAGSLSSVSAVADVSGRGNVGGLVGYVNAAGSASVTGARASGAVSLSGYTGTAYAGGLFGQVHFGNAADVLSDAKATGTVTATGSSTAAIYLGGVAGYVVGGSITDAQASGAVTFAYGGSGNPNGAIGGLVGTFSGGAVTASSASGKVSGGGDAGGLLGESTASGVMTGLTATGDVSGAYRVGGLVGQADGAGSFFDVTASGLVSSTSTANNSYTGGLIGWLHTGGGLDKGTYTGTAVSGNWDVGGLLGNVYINGSVTRSSTAATVTGNGAASVGGLVGYFRTDTAGQGIADSSASGAVTMRSGGGGNVGGLVGRSENFNGGGVFARVQASGDVAFVYTGASGSGDGRAGGLMGYFSGASLNDATAGGKVSGGNYAGGLVGEFYAAGANAKLVATGNVSGLDRVGGLFGHADGAGSLASATASGQVSGTGSYGGGLAGFFGLDGGLAHGTATGAVTGTANAGGLVGEYASNGKLTDSTAGGNVAGRSNVGGLVGYVSASGGLERVGASGNVSLLGNGNNATLGGLVGQSFTGSITDATATGNVTGVGNSTVYAGGLVGNFCYYSNYYCSGVDAITGSSATGNVTVDATYGAIGGLVGNGNWNDGGIVKSQASGTVRWIESTGGSYSTRYAGGVVGQFSGGTGSTIDHASATGDVSGGTVTGGLAGYFVGGTLNQLQAGGKVTGSNQVGGLIGTATLYGAGTHLAASGDVLSLSASSYVGGLFGYLYLVNNGTLSGSLAAAVASGKVTALAQRGEVGGLIGHLDNYSNAANTPALSDVQASGDVSGGAYSGGLIGQAYGGNSSSGGIVRAVASGAVTGGNYAGGLIGTLYNYRSSAGGLPDIDDSHASGSVSGGNIVGGLIGQYQGYHGISASWATGDVLGSGNSNSALYLGGLVGQLYGYGSGAAVTGSFAGGRVRLDASATSAIASGSVFGGGLVGYLYGTDHTTTPTVVDSYAAGGVNLDLARSYAYLGGLVGYSQTQVIARSYATGAVSATAARNRYIGGLVGNNYNSIVQASYWNVDATGQTSSPGSGSGNGNNLPGGSNAGIGLSAAQAATASSYAGWDLATTANAGKTWRIYDGFGAPLLTRFLQPLALNLSDLSKTYDGGTGLGDAVLKDAGGKAVAHPERIFAALPSADASATPYTLAANRLYSVQNGYDLDIVGSGKLTVNPKPITLTGLVADKVYDGGTAATLVAGAQPVGLVAGESLAITVGAAAFDSRNAGSARNVTLTGVTVADGAHGKASNYTVTGSATAAITPAPVTVGAFSAADRVYDGSTAVSVSLAPAATVGGVLGADDVRVDVSGVGSGRLADKNAGTAKPVTVLGASLSGADAANYRIDGIDTVTVNITPKPLTANGITAGNRSYDASTRIDVFTGSASLSGAVAGDQVALISTTLGGGGRTADKNVGTAKAVTVTGTLPLRGADAGNYTVSAGPVTVDITPYDLYFYAFRTGATDRVYDGSTTASIGVSTYYSPYSGDDLKLVYDAPQYEDKNVKLDSAGRVTSKSIVVTGGKLTGADAGNYRLNSFDGSSGSTLTAHTSGTISPKPVAVTGVAAVDRVYDGTRNVSVNVAAATVDTAALVAGDDVSVTQPGSGTVVGTMADKNVGNAKAVTVPGLALVGADRANYTLSGTAGVTVKITPKDLTAVYTAADKVYDGQVWASVTVTSPDVLSGDDVRYYADKSYTVGYTPFALPGATVRSYTTSKDVALDASNAPTTKPVVVTFNGLYGNDAANYTLLNTTGLTSATITPKPITPVYAASGTKVYDDTLNATVVLNAFASGIVSGDAASVTQTALFTDSKNVGTAKPVAVSGIAFTGANAANYSLVKTTATTTASVTPKAVTITGLAGVDRAYDGTLDVALTTSGASVSGAVTGDDLRVVDTTGGTAIGRMADKNAGKAKPLTVSASDFKLAGDDAGNYTAGATSATVTITPKPLTVAYVDGATKVYDGFTGITVTPQSAASLGIVTGDVLTISQSAAFTGADARNVDPNGAAKPIAVSGITLGGADRANYALQNTTATTTGSITPKTVGLSFSALDRVYDGVGDRSVDVVARTLDIFPTDGVSVTQSAQLRGDGSAGSAKPVDVTGIALQGDLARNYTLASTTATTQVTVQKRPLPIAGLTAVDRSYDGTLTVQVDTTGAKADPSAVIAGDDVRIVPPASALIAGTLASKAAGTRREVSIDNLDLAGASAANYRAAGATGLTVNIAPLGVTATYAAADKVYDGAVTASVTGSLGGVLTADLGGLGLQASGVFATGKDAGSAKAVSVTSAFLTGVERDNYRLTNPTGSASATISPRLLTPRFVGGSKVYDGQDWAPVMLQGTNALAGDDVGVIDTATFSGADAKAVARNAAGTQVVAKPVDVTGIALTGNDAGNYRLAATSATTTATITPKPLRIDGLAGVVAHDRVYDGTRTVAVEVTANGTLVPSSRDIVAGDTVAIALPASGLTTGSTDTKNVGKAKPVVVDGLSLSGADAGNYSVAAATGVTVEITPRPLTAVYAGVDKVYDGTVAATLSGSSTDILAVDAATVAVAGTGVFTAGKNVGTGKAVEVQRGTLVGPDAGNYSLANPTGSASAAITPRPVTVSYSGSCKVYDGTVAAPVVAASRDLIAGDDVAIGQTAVFTGADAKNVGEGKPVAVSAIALSGADRGNYRLQTTSAATQSAVTPRPIVLQGLSLAAVDRVYDGTLDVDVTVATGGGAAGPRPGDLIAGDAIALSVPTAGTTTGHLADKNAGQDKPVVTVDGLSLTGADSRNYRIAGVDGLSANIAQRPVTASWVGVSRTYDGSAAATVVGTSSDIVGGDDLRIDGSGVFTAGRNAGTGKAIAVQAAALGGGDAGNYTLANPTGSATADILPKPLAVDYVGGSRVYDGTVGNAPVVAALAGVVGGDRVGTQQTAAFTGDGAKNVGTAKPVAVTGITLAGDDAGNYVLPATTATTTANITPKPLTIGGLGVLTATDRVYDGSTTVKIAGLTALSPSSSDIVAGDDVAIRAPSVDASGQGSGTMLDKSAGLAKPVVLSGLSLTGTDAGNYSIGAVANLTVNIAPKPITASFTGVNRVYDGTALATALGSSADIVSGDSLTILGSGVFSDGKNVGTGKPLAVQSAKLAGPDAGNYTLTTTTGSTVADVTPRTLTAGYTGGSRVYDGTLANAPVSAVLADAVAGDDLGTLQTAVFTDSKNVGSAKPVAVSGITLTGADAGNYALASTTASTTAEVTQRPLVVTGLNGLKAVDRVYDGTTTVSVVSTGPLSASGSTGVLAGDTVALSLDGSAGTGTLDDKNAGLAKPVAYGGIALTGPDAANYRVGGTPDLKVDIAPLPVTATLAALDKVYDGRLDATVTGSLGAVIAGDQVALGTVRAAFADRNVGSAKPVTVAGLTLTGADAGNYAVTPDATPLAAAITPRSVSATYAGISRVYDATTAALVSGRSGDLLAGDQVTIAGSGVYTDSANAGTAKPIAVQSAALAGADSANYRLANPTGSAVGDVTPRPLAVTIGTVVRYADAADALKLEVRAGDGGLLGSDALDGRGAPVVDLKSLPSDGGVIDLLPTGVGFASGLAGNYAIRYVPGRLIVLPRQPQIDDVATQSGGGTGLAVDVAQFNEDDVRAARDALDRAAQQPTKTGTPPARTAAVDKRAVQVVGEEASLAALAQGDPLRITARALQPFPLFSIDPRLLERLVTAVKP